jgi:glycosyltransferase involved in cell wall biosynthesis
MLFGKSKTLQSNWIPTELFNTLLYLSNFWPRPSVNSSIIADAVEIKRRRKYSYSIIIPCYNEEGNIRDCIKRVPSLSRDIEIIVVNDGSNDNTARIVSKMQKTDKRIKLVTYSKNRGKGYATGRGMEQACKDIIIILDADMTVEPEKLPLFIEPFEFKIAEFVNGTRLVYPLADQAMRGLHIIGNMLFSKLFSYILSQPLTDTLCGTKCLYRKDFERMALKDNAWPDFDLLFEASRLNL